MDLSEYTDEQLADLRVAILTEQERRARVADAPAQITDLIKQAVRSGADPDTIRDAVEDGLTPEQIQALRG